MAKSKIIPLDVMFYNDKGDVFDFTNVTLYNVYGDRTDCMYSTSHVIYSLGTIFNKGNHVNLLKKISRTNPQEKNNIYGPCKQLRELDKEIAQLEKELESKKLLKANIEDESKHIKHVKLTGKFEGCLVFN